MSPDYLEGIRAFLRRRIMSVGSVCMKPVRLSGHSRRYMARRGFTAEDVEEAIRNNPWKPADLGRMQCEQVFPFGQEWNGQTYAFKRVRPVFAETDSEIVVVTVYTFFF